MNREWVGIGTKILGSEIIKVHHTIVHNNFYYLNSNKENTTVIPNRIYD